ncbi:MAG: hypothetical protein H7Y13_06185 [Sphingobacteriaceae bacterium]|nr:hypothetical protein [Sphingobacteriaceae bacterium]
MINQTVELQAKMYVFDLGNCAKEFWFKDDEDWDLCLASGEQKLELEKKYYPTISKKGIPETLILLHGLVKNRLLKVNPLFLKPGHSEEMSAAPEFLIAFNRNRRR